MREIKFRGMSVHELASGNRWLYGNVCIGEYSYIEDMPVDEKTVGQYTGLKDKNGKEIFEGDIIQQNYRDVYNQKQAFTGEVVYADCVYWLKNSDEYTFLYDEHRIYDSVVIGNIHENPELLEVAV